MEQSLEALIAEPLLQKALEGIQEHLNRPTLTQEAQTIERPEESHLAALAQMETRQAQLQI